MGKKKVSAIRPGQGGGSWTGTFPTDAFNVHVLSWPNGAITVPDPFASGVSADNRRFLKWMWHEETEGVYTWYGWMYDPSHSYYANPMDAFASWDSNGKKIAVLVVDYRTIPTWATIGNMTQYGNFISALCTEISPYAIEFVNEPSGVLTAAEVYDVYAATYSVVKAASPSTLVVGPACESILRGGGNGTQFVKDFLDAGGGSYIDAISVHMYCYGETAHDPHSLVDQCAYFKSEIASRWSGPIWNTESGGAYVPAEYWSALTDAQREHALFQHLVVPILRGYTKSFWYAFGEDNLGPYTAGDPPLYGRYPANIVSLMQSIKALEGQQYNWVDNGYTVTVNTPLTTMTY
jgi:hypothetical protein